MLVFKGATLGDASVELVKLENKKYKTLNFSDEMFTTLYSSALKRNKLQCVFSTTGDPIVQIYAESCSPANLILKIRVKVEATSRQTTQGKAYSPYMRNLVEAGPRMFSLL
jgi:hypothetical protein